MMQKRKRRFRQRQTLRSAAICVLLAVMIFSGIKLIRYLISSAKRNSNNAELAELYEKNEEADETAEPETELPETPHERRTVFHTITGNVLSSAQELYSRNRDLTAWIKIPDVLSLPVVYRDNTYYLTHDFYGGENEGGTVFLDMHHPLTSDSQYLIVHGHNMYDGSMFARITHYRNSDYIKKHPIVYFNTLYAHETYKIIGSLCLTESEMYTVARLGRPTFDSDEDFNSFIDDLRSHAIYFTRESISPDTPLLALSTCYDDKRIVAVFARVED